MTFDKLGLRPALLARLAEQNLNTPTPIQTRAIPEAMQGHDVLGLAQTGTGKTLAFGLPIADALLGQAAKCEPKSTRALILAPTRELAQQTPDNLPTNPKDPQPRGGLARGGGRGRAGRVGGKEDRQATTVARQWPAAGFVATEIWCL